MKNKFLLYIALFILHPGTAYAYLDPGTGSIIIQAILGAIAAGFMTISIWWHKFKLFMKKFLNFLKKNNDK